MWWVLPLIGAGIGALGTGQSLRKQRDALKKQQEAAKKQYEYGKELSEKQWGIQRGEAEYQLGTQERALHEGMGQFADEYNTAMLARAFGEQDARIQNAANAGMSRVQEGMSGTRGNAANETVRAYASQSLDRNIEIQDRQSKGQLDKMITGANMTVNAIEHEKASWMPGGHRVRAKESQDAYNLNIANLGQSNFDWHIDQATPTFMDYFTGIMGGASSGAKFGGRVSKFIDNGDIWNFLGL